MVCLFRDASELKSLFLFKFYGFSIGVAWILRYFWFTASSVALIKLTIFIIRIQINITIFKFESKLVFESVFGSNIFFIIALQTKVPLTFRTIIKLFLYLQSKSLPNYFLFFIFIFTFVNL